MMRSWRTKRGSGEYTSGPFTIRRRPVKGDHPTYYVSGPGVGAAHPSLHAAKWEAEGSPYALAEELEHRVADATHEHQTYYDHNHVSDDEGYLLRFVLDNAEHLIRSLKEASNGPVL